MKLQNWILKAMLLGSVFFIAALFVKPVGVSTQFSVLSGMIHSSIDQNVITTDDTRDTGYKSSNAYYDKSDGKLAKSIKNPINYDFVFVLAIPLGAYMAYILKDKRKKTNPKQMQDEIFERKKNYKGNFKIYLPSFLGGFLLLYGARMADGCTSGHMMSGIMQGSVSGYIFACAVFLVAIPIAIYSGMNHKSKGGE